MRTVSINRNLIAARVSRASQDLINAISGALFSISKVNKGVSRTLGVKVRVRNGPCRPSDNADNRSSEMSLRVGEINSFFLTGLLSSGVGAAGVGKSSPVDFILFVSQDKPNLHDIHSDGLATTSSPSG